MVKLTRVQIKNWRSVKEVDFYPEDVTVLVGPNNAGKTNVMSAIAFLLGDRYPTPASLNPEDHYGGDPNRHISIRLGVDHPDIDAVDFDTDRDRFVFRAWQHDGRYFAPTSAQREEWSFAYVDAARSFDRQFGASRWSLFGQAVRRLHRDLTGGGEGEALPRLRVLLEEAHELLRTETYRTFEAELKSAFSAQLKTAGYGVDFEFRTLDESNLYRSLYPTLIERGVAKSPAEAGSGIRNLLVLALFQAVARTFRDGAVLAIEEPELYLHPHAQRSLMASFEELAGAGNQVFVSTHSAAFVDVTRSERVVLIDRCADDDQEVCTQSRTTSAQALLTMRQRLHPALNITDVSRRAFLRGIKTAEMAEAFFARLVVVVEGPSEREALPRLLVGEGLNLDELGVSIVSAGGKAAIDTVSQLYSAHGIPTFVIFDNDDGGNPRDLRQNRVLCRLLGLPEEDLPAPRIAPAFAILDGCWERQIERELETVQPGEYARIVGEGRALLGLSPDRNKPLVARYVADELVGWMVHLPFVTAVATRLRTLLAELDAVPAEPDPWEF